MATVLPRLDTSGISMQTTAHPFYMAPLDAGAGISLSPSCELMALSSTFP